ERGNGMKPTLLHHCFLAAAAALIGGAIPVTAYAGADPGLLCEKAAGKSLVTCVGRVAKEEGKCYAGGGSACAASDAKIADALAKLGKTVGKKCPTDAVVQAAGYGPTMTAAALLARLESICQADTASLASRSFGGPQGASLAAASDTGKACLSALH